MKDGKTARRNKTIVRARVKSRNENIVVSSSESGF